MRYGKDEQERMEPGKRKIKKESTPSHGEESGKKKEAKRCVLFFNSFKLAFSFYFILF
jgi:hypothetical protein